MAKATSDAEFIEMVGYMMEFLLPKHLGEDLGVKPEEIEQWLKGTKLPMGKKREKYFRLMQRHEVWNDL